MKNCLTPHYRFALLSDIHIDLENGGKNTYFRYAEQNLIRALDVICQRDCDFIVSAGDQVTNAAGSGEEWKRYRAILRASGYARPVLEALGNHETRYAKYGGCSVCDCIDEFIRYTDLAQKPVSRPQGKPYYAYIGPQFGDTFLFMALENGVNTNEIDNFSDEQLDWLEENLMRCRAEKRRAFVIQHAPLFGSGIGDDPTQPAYEGSMRLTDKNGAPFRGNSRFVSLMREHRSIIWLSGHTHVDLRDGVNFGAGELCCMLHIPALAGTTRLAYDQNGRRVLDRTFYPDATQGYLADVYEDRVCFAGIDFYRNCLLPQYTYTVYR